jgi:hypothetical protein
MSAAKLGLWISYYELQHLWSLVTLLEPSQLHSTICHGDRATVLVSYLYKAVTGN